MRFDFNSSSKKGLSGVMLMIVFVIIIIIITGVLGGGIIGRVAGQMLGEDVVCPVYCDIQASIQGYSFWRDNIGSRLVRTFTFFRRGSPVSISTIASETIKDFGIDVESMGCYCGASERKGKYIHIYGSASDETITEFHLTEQNPEKHLNYELLDSDGEIIYTHRVNEEDGYKECVEAVDTTDDFEDLTDLDNYDGCIILSNTDERCALWLFREGSALWNKKGYALSEIGDYADVIYNRGSNEDIVDSAHISQSLEVSHGGIRNAFQTMLLLRYWSGPQPFELYAPLVCKSTDRESRETGTDLDKACAEQCQLNNEILWGSGCFKQEDAPIGYEMLDYDEDEEEFCEGEEGDAWCLCVAEKEYFWEINEEYKPEDE